MEKFPGAESKIEEYVTRIQNGEDKEFVLQGLGPAFRDPVETKLAESTNDTAIPAPIEHKKSDFNDSEHQMGIDIYNTFANIGNGMAKGLRENFDPKIAQYVADIKSGKSKQYVLGGAPKSMVDAVEKELAKEQQDTSLEKATGIEAIRAKILAVADTHYIFTHQTDESVAKNIFETNFEVSPGTGITSTMTWQSGESAVNQIERQLDGDAHRGYKGMFIVAIPKQLLENGSRNKGEALENMLLESLDYGKNGNSNLVIPKEYNFAYLQGEDLYIHKSFS